MSEWIKVADKNPKEGIDVLIWDELLQQPLIGYLKNFRNGKHFMSSSYVLTEIKWWMPLPERPNE